MLAETTIIERQKPIGFHKPELIIGYENKAYFLEKLEKCNSSFLCLAKGQHTLDVIKNKENVEAIKSFNWIPLCVENKSLSLSLAQALVYSLGWKQDFGLDMVAHILTSVFSHTSTLADPTPYEAYELINTSKISSLVNTLLESPNQIARYYAGLFAVCPERSRKFLIGGAIGKLDWLENHSLRDFTSSMETPNFKKLREETRGFYLDITEQNNQEIAPLTSLFVDLALYQLKHSKNHKTVYLFIDDLNSIGYLNNLYLNFSTIRACNIGLVFAVPSFQELEKFYGQSEAKIILDNSLTS